ncbi:uncharacterized protein LOC141711869 [Apium graveolens]|uniref:uncharacterized protein LOC141711869 n=1 Tax=Apium graveolens TaxID=4045 RepID=UPI003D798570
MACITTGQLYRLSGSTSFAHISSPGFAPHSLSFINNNDRLGSFRLAENSGFRNSMSVPSATSGIFPVLEDDDGVSLGTMKLPPDTDIPRFETLLFQWANSLCQGANLPLPVPLKIDKIAGGVRLGFITIGDGGAELPVYIDCLVYPPTDGVIPIFRAVRNGEKKDKTAPGEERIMKSLLGALKKSVEIARL